MLTIRIFLFPYFAILCISVCAYAANTREDRSQNLSKAMQAIVAEGDPSTPQGMRQTMAMLTEAKGKMTAELTQQQKLLDAMKGKSPYQVITAHDGSRRNISEEVEFRKQNIASLNNGIATADKELKALESKLHTAEVSKGVRK